jgi:diguanylate cyclase (GGDEF)-like protein
MSAQSGVDPQDPVTPEEWRQLSALESDIVLVVDAAGVCQWADGAPWLGHHLRDLFATGDHAVLDQLCASEATGPLWIRQGSPLGEVRWLHAVSVPRPEGGWVVQIRQSRQVDSATHSDANGLDHVTGVVGRERALDEVAFLLAATPRTGRETAIVCCALDNFPALADTHGQQVADEVLRVLAGRISDTVRSGDLVARIDDEEMLIVLRGVHHLRGALRVSNKIAAVVADPITVGQVEIVQTMCVGVTIISRGEGVDSVLERARGAVAMAQDAGPNMVMSSPPI